MSDFDLSVLEYLGTLENGVLCIISIMYKGQYFEGTFFYTKEDFVFTISEELESIVGDIKKHPKYLELVRRLLRLTVPYDEIFNTLDPADFTKWVKGVIELEGLEMPRIIDESEIKPLPGVG